MRYTNLYFTYLLSYLLPLHYYCYYVLSCRSLFWQCVHKWLCRSSLCRAEIYAGRVACCPWWVTGETNGQTDGRQAVTLRFPLKAARENKTDNDDACDNSCLPAIATLTWYSLEDLDTLVDRLVRIRHVLVHLLGIDVRERIIHPAVVPPQPVARSNPQHPERLKVLRQLGHFVKLNVAHIHTEIPAQR